VDKGLWIMGAWRARRGLKTQRVSVAE
jgi:hypothetical protein